MHFTIAICLRYYATFKVRKFELLLYKINTCFQKNYHLHWIAGRVNILSKDIINIFQFWTWLLRFLSYIISKSYSFLLQKHSEQIFATLYFYIYELKKCLKFLKSYFKLEIIIFLSFPVSFLVHMFNWKAPFLTENISSEIWDTL